MSGAVLVIFILLFLGGGGFCLLANGIFVRSDDPGLFHDNLFGGPDDGDSGDGDGGESE